MQILLCKNDANGKILTFVHNVTLARYNSDNIFVYRESLNALITSFISSGRRRMHSSIIWAGISP